MLSELPSASDERAAGDVSDLWMRFTRLFPTSQVLAYLIVGVCNTLFGYALYAIFVHGYGRFLPIRYLPFTVDLATITATPFGVTFSFLTYKRYVFKTEGDYKREWLRCFAVYGTAMIPNLFILPVVTRALQSMQRLHGSAAAYLAGAIVMGCTTIYTYLAHKNFSFSRRNVQ